MPDEPVYPHLSDEDLDEVIADMADPEAPPLLVETLLAINVDAKPTREALRTGEAA